MLAFILAVVHTFDPLPGDPHRLIELEGLISRHLDHISKLEQVLRLLENDQVGEKS